MRSCDFRSDMRGLSRRVVSEDSMLEGGGGGMVVVLRRW
jgi:hypothetical protein